MTTILGQHISTIRPTAPRKSIIYNNERPYARRQARSGKCKTLKVKYITVKVIGGNTFSLNKGTHLDVINAFNLSPEQVISTGWTLEDNEFLWR